MLYRLNTLSREELEKLYVTEMRKLLAAVDSNSAYNTVQSIRLNIAHIENKLQLNSVKR